MIAPASQGRGGEGGFARRLDSIADAVARAAATPVGLATLLFLPLSAMALRLAGADPDLFARVAVGRLVERDGHPPYIDPFAYTPRRPSWVDHEWLSGVTFHRLVEWGRDPALVAAMLVGILLTVVLLVAAARRFAAPGPGRGAWLAVCVLPSAFVWWTVVRSQLFTYLILAAFLFAFVDYRRRRDPRSLALLPLLMVPWTNLHGGFVVGLGLLGVFAVAGIRDGRRFALPLWLALAGCGLATLVNPYGPGYWSYILEAVSMPRPRISEWRPAASQPLLLTWVLVVATAWVTARVVGMRRGERVPLEALLVPAAALFFGLRSARLAATFFFAVAVYGADVPATLLGTGPLSARAVRTRLRKLRRAGALLVPPAAVALAVPIAAFLARPGAYRLDLSRYPVEAADWLQASGASGRLLVSYNDGSYALWRLHPALLVSMDGRYEEVYPESTVEDVAAAVDPAAPGHSAALARLRPDWILAVATGPEALAAWAPDWEPLFFGGGWAVLRRAGETPPRDGPRRVRPLWTPAF